MKRLFLCLLLSSTSLASFSTVPTAAAENKVYLLVRAFIPDKLPGKPGVIKQIPGGRTGISNPMGTGCFLTDNRWFSPKAGESARAIAEFDLLIPDSGPPTIAKVNGEEMARIGETHQVDCSTGNEISHGSAQPSDIVIGAPSKTNDVTKIRIHAHSINPLLIPFLKPEHQVGPDLDFDLTFSFDPKDNSLIFDGEVDQFPCYEAYAKLNEGPVTKLFEIEPPPGRGPWGLVDMGHVFHRTPAKDTVYLKDSLTGKWQSTDAGKRFLLEIKSDGNVVWTENATSGSFTRTVPLISKKNAAEYRIERANDDPALAFLGFQPTLRSQILAKGPRPSFIVLRKYGNEIRGQWNGLLATKNNDANLETLVQPGDRPAKEFIFQKLP